MYISLITSELAPIAKVGGLGDVAYGLAKSLQSRGHRVEVILPKYRLLDHSFIDNLEPAERFETVEGNLRVKNRVWKGWLEKVPIFLIESAHPSEYFNRKEIYGTPDDPERFLYFSRAVLDFFKLKNSVPDILHLHDWPVSIIPLLKKQKEYQMLSSAKTVLTLHNLEHQGKCNPYLLKRIGLPPERLASPELIKDLHYQEQINLLRAGIEYCDGMTTVSPTYRQEILTSECSAGLLSVLQKNEKKLQGILNGIDDQFWDPKEDRFLPYGYPVSRPQSTKDIGSIREAKKKNRKVLQALFDLENKEVPLVGVVARLVPQKGPDLIEHALRRTLEKKGQFVLLARTPIPEIERQFLSLKEEFSDDRDVGISLESEEKLAHLLYASCDIFVIPSIFEPCGLTQMIAMRYGAVPVARWTGGLKDTVFDWETSSLPQKERNGFTFEHADALGLDWALDRALEKCHRDAGSWAELMVNGMRKDFGWGTSAAEYEKFFSSLVTRT